MGRACCWLRGDGDRDRSRDGRQRKLFFSLKLYMVMS